MKKPRNVLLYDPYLPTLGGGERYIYSLAAFFAAEGLHVVVGAPKVPAREALESFGFDPEICREVIPFEQLERMAPRYDIFICSTLQMPPAIKHPDAYLVVQFPFPAELRFPRLLRRQKLRSNLRRYRCVAYSEYAKEWIRKRWGTDAVVLPPAVTQGHYDPQRKRRLILSVGRFFPGQHSKRQDVLIQAFKMLPADVRRDWTLVLAGGLQEHPENLDYLNRLRAEASGENVEFAVNVPQAELAELYSQASVFWHATGFGRAPDEPEKAEHFGITTVEAMSYGCVPMAYDDGGQAEILQAVGVLWKTPQSLVDATVEHVTDAALMQTTARKVVERAAGYAPNRFAERCHQVFAATWDSD